MTTTPPRTYSNIEYSIRAIIAALGAGEGTDLGFCYVERDSESIYWANDQINVLDAAGNVKPAQPDIEGSFEETLSFVLNLASQPSAEAIATCNQPWERRGSLVYTEDTGEPGTATCITECKSAEAAQRIVDQHNAFLNTAFAPVITWEQPLTPCGSSTNGLSNSPSQLNGRITIAGVAFYAEAYEVTEGPPPDHAQTGVLDESETFLPEILNIVGGAATTIPIDGRSYVLAITPSQA
jgi:hypothetical protein